MRTLPVLALLAALVAMPTPAAEAGAEVKLEPVLARSDGKALEVGTPAIDAAGRIICISPPEEATVER